MNKSNVGSDYPDNVGFTISSVGISLTPRKPQVLTNIEEWTTAFNTYVLIVVQKFPNRATELLQYMETIRYAAKTHGGLGWCIYDHKFRHKAASCRTLSWANIDTQLWLRIFTASATQLHEDYSLFSNGPSNRAGATREEFATATTGVDLAHFDPIAHTFTDATDLALGENIPGTNVHKPAKNPHETKINPPDLTVAPRRQPENRTDSHKSNINNSSNLIPLAFDPTIVTPIRVDALEHALLGHPDRSFVLKLCSDLRFGARLGYDRPRMSKFSKNLKSAVDNPTIVSSNLAKEVALGHTAGPFTNPPFVNLQVSPIGIVPKNIRINFEPFSTFPFQKQANQSILLSRKTNFRCNT